MRAPRGLNEPAYWNNSSFRTGEIRGPTRARISRPRQAHVGVVRIRSPRAARAVRIWSRDGPDSDMRGGEGTLARVKKYAPSAERNRDPILKVMRRHFPERGVVLEIASGSGQHAVHVAGALQGLCWQPSDPDPSARASITAWVDELGLSNVRAPVALDTRANIWPVESADVVVCINMIHISPWTSCQGLMRGSGRILTPGGLLFLYGPYKRDGEHTAPSNAAFDEGLRARDSTWGVRDLGEVTTEANGHGLRRIEVTDMPANNLSVVFAKE